MASLTLSDIRKSYGLLDVIKGIDLFIEDGEFIVFVGPSGCGKSTLLRMIAGLEEISGGQLLIDQKLCNDLSAKERGIAMVFQSYALYPHMTVRQNIGWGLKIAGMPKSEVQARTEEAARILQISHLLERRPSQLSGGQRQRVAIGRAIVRAPKVFLFDEPLSNLDAALRVSTRREIAKLHEDLGATMIYVTHDQIEAMTLADRIVVLNGGHIEQVGTPSELYNTPANLFVAGFIGSPKMNILPAVATADGLLCAGLLAVPLRAGTAGDKLHVGIRPEHLFLWDNGLRAEVLLMENLGDETLLEVRLEDGLVLTLRAEANGQYNKGDSVKVAFDPKNFHIFNADGQRIALN